MYQPIFTAEDGEQLPYPISSRPSQARALSSYSFVSADHRTPSYSAQSSRSIDSKGTSTLTSETATVKEEESLDAETVDVFQRQTVSFWTRYNVLTERGRRLLCRKLLRSGPADLTEDPSEGRRYSKPRSETRNSGWRTGTRVCCCAVICCIIIEAVLLIWAVKTSVGGAGSGLLYEGNCEKVKSMAVWLLLPLNIAAPVLIGTSNYVMQVMAAPDRTEIDLAHRFARSIAVGGIRFQDLRSGHGGHRRRAIWWLLGLSSLPIHLLLNSAIYSSVQASNSGVLVVSDDFESDSTWSHCSKNLTDNFLTSYFACSLMQSFKAGKTQELSRDQCISQYASGFQTNASSVIVVTSAGSKSWYSLPESAKVPPSYGIACQFNYSDLKYVQVPFSERNFEFSYAPEAGNASVTLSFSTHCENQTKTINGTQTWALNVSNSNLITPSYSSTNALFYRADSALSSVESIRSIFSALDYRYWATAEMTGDYLNKDYQTLLRGWDARSWLCPDTDLANVLQCDPTQLITGLAWTITPAAMPVTKCHVLPKEELCDLRYSWKILLVTLFCDVLKLTAMVLALKFISEPLTTLGDVIASFLQNPDPYTKGQCLLDDDAASSWTAKSRAKVVSTVQRYFTLRGYDWKEGNHGIWRGYSMPVVYAQPTQFEQESYHWMLDGGQWWTTIIPAEGGERWKLRSRRWVAVPSKLRWLSFAILYLLLMISTIVYLASGVKSLQSQRLTSIWTVGFSGPDPNALWTGGIMSGASSITWVAILVNLPQVLFSMLYFVFNAILTMMHTAHEWSSFARHRKALRVSSPRGKQRSTYWLQLPWSYSLPMIVASGSLHWLLGRSVYLVKVDVYGYFGHRQADKDFFACGYSPITVLILIVLLALMGVALIAVATRKLESGSSLVRLNSLAIAAACHANPAETGLATEPLMWGVIRDESGADTAHCSFSAKEVSPLSEGVVYS